MNKYCPEGDIFLGGDQRTIEMFTAQQRQAANGNREEQWSRFHFMSLDFHLLINLADVRAAGIAA